MRILGSVFQFLLCLLRTHESLAKSLPLSLSFIILKCIEEAVTTVTHISLEALPLFISDSFAKLLACRVTSPF